MTQIQKIEKKGWKFYTLMNGKVCAKKGSQTIVGYSATEILRKIS